MDIKDMKVDMLVTFNPNATRNGERISKDACDPDHACVGRVIKIDAIHRLVKVAWSCSNDRSNSGLYWYYAEQCMLGTGGGF